MIQAKRTKGKGQTTRIGREMCVPHVGVCCQLPSKGKKNFLQHHKKGSYKMTLITLLWFVLRTMVDQNWMGKNKGGKTRGGNGCRHGFLTSLWEKVVVSCRQLVLEAFGGVMKLC